MISIAALVRAVVLSIVAGLIFWLLSWLVDYVGVPEPFQRIARVVLAIFAVLVVISILLYLAGIPVLGP